jgi:hypothetical protein
MHRKRLILTLTAVIASIALVPVATAFGSSSGPHQTASRVEALTALGTTFTYQGRLSDGGSPANGSYDIRFILYDSESGGAQVGNTVIKTTVSVAGGLFNADLDFGTIAAAVTPSPSPSVSPTVTAVPTVGVVNAFDGNARWMEIAVRAGGTSGTFTVLSPRQSVSAVPYAFYAKAAGGFAVPLTASGSTSGAQGALDVTQSGTGIGIAGRRTTTDSSLFPGVYGFNAGGGAGVQGESTFAGGIGVQGFGNGAPGIGGKFTGTEAVELDGAIKVVGTKAAFQIAADTATNTCNTNRGVVLSSPMLDGDANAIVFVTYIDPSPATLDNDTALSVVYNLTGCAAAANKWVAYFATSTGAFITGDKVNVLVIKQ